MAEYQPKAKRPRVELSDFGLNDESIESSEDLESPTDIGVSTQLMDLNDDCFLKVLKYMELDELETVANTCMRLRDITRYHFRLKHKHLDFNEMANKQTDAVQFIKARGVLRSFGDTIVTLKLSGQRFGSLKEVLFILLHINRCCPKILTDLTLESCEIPSYVMLAMQPLFSRLQKLELIDSELNLTAASFSQLKVLKLTGIDLQMNIFPMLEEIHFKECSSNSELLPDLIRLHTDLKYLSIVDHLGLLNASLLEASLLNQLIENNIKIEHLYLSYGYMNADAYENLPKLINLKKLELNGMIVDNSSQMNRTLVKIPSQLEELRINTRQSFDATALKILLRGANQLSMVEIDSPDMEYNLEVYNNVLNIVKQRPMCTRLEIVIHRNFMLTREAKTMVSDRGILVFKETDRHINPIFPFSFFDALENDFGTDSDSSDSEDDFDSEFLDDTDQEDIENDADLFYGIQFAEGDIESENSSFDLADLF